MSDYKIYPSLLDKFQDLLDADIFLEESSNKVSEACHERGEYLDKDVGDYKLNSDEMSEKLEIELLYSINRVKRDPSMASDKGTCFNEVIDCLIDNRKCGKQGMTISCEGDAIVATYEGFTFRFDKQFCIDFASQLAGSAAQLFTKGIMETRFGTVEIYGFIDYYRLDQIIDVKTTNQYDFLKFENKWQRHVYPYCLVESGHEVNSFEYRVVKWKGGTNSNPTLSGEVIPEYYNYNHEESCIMLKAQIEDFIEWLDMHRNLITDCKIFS